MNIYKLNRTWWNFCFDNPEKINPNHTALYFFAIEHCNRLGWKKKFGLPTTMAKEAIGIRSYNTYIKILNDLIDFGFIILIEKSRNQYSSNIIALSNFDKAHDKALDKAMIKHMTKQRESTIQSIDSIIIQIYNRQYTNIQVRDLQKAIDENYKLDEQKIQRENVRSFYDNQIQTLSQYPLLKNQQIKYRAFVDYLFGKNDFGEELTNILYIKNQLSFERFCKIYSKDQGGQFIGSLKAMYNYENQDKIRSYRDLGTTIENWMKNVKPE